MLFRSYAATKKADELLAHTYNHIHGVAITALRFFTVYGPYGRPDMAYFSFANNIVRGKPITIFKGENDAELARDFTYIDDVVQGVIASLETSEASGKRVGRAPMQDRHDALVERPGRAVVDQRVAFRIEEGDHAVLIGHLRGGHRGGDPR